MNILKVLPKTLIYISHTPTLFLEYSFSQNKPFYLRGGFLKGNSFLDLIKMIQTQPYILSLGPGPMGYLELFLGAALTEVYNTGTFDMVQLYQKFKGIFERFKDNMFEGKIEGSISLDQILHPQVIIDIINSIDVTQKPKIRSFEGETETFKHTQSAYEAVSQSRRLTDYDLSDNLTVDHAVLRPEYLVYVGLSDLEKEYFEIIRGAPNLDDVIEELGKPVAIVSRNFILPATNIVYHHDKLQFFKKVTDLAQGAPVFLVEQYVDIVYVVNEMVWQSKKATSLSLPFDFDPTVPVNHKNWNNLLTNPLLDKKFPEIQDSLNLMIGYTGSEYQAEIKTYGHPHLTVLMTLKPAA